MNKDSIEYIHEPLEEFKNKYKDRHYENVTKYFEKLVSEAKINIEENQETIKKLRKNEKEANNLKKIISRFNLLKIFLIILIVVSIVMGYSSGSNLVYGITESSNIILLTISIVVIIGSLILIFASINPKVKELKISKKELQEKIKELTKLAWQQMEPLNRLFDDNMSIDLCKQTLPLINFDNVFDRRRLEYLVRKFGYNPDNDKNRSKLYVRSGEITGNPFFIAEDLVHRLGTKTYTGSKVISWTTTTRVNGKVQTVRRTQTLTASLTKPCPYYHTQKYLVYGNDAAPDLTFKRYETDVENYSEKQIERKVSREIKKLEKKSRKAIKKGENYTVLGHSEFEVLFGATDRNNEVQFRLLFTPLAIKQLLALMKEKKYGYGDEFNFIKVRKINYIFPKHLNNFKLDAGPNYYYSYDFNEIKGKFISYNVEFFRQIYFSFAPLLAIPLYQQTKPHEFIYEDLYDSYLSFYEHEKIVNDMNANEFIHPLSQTRNILKTSVINSTNNCDTLEVIASGYQTIRRVDYVTKLGGDGRHHQVPVEWIDYIPVEKNTVMEVKYFDEKEEVTPAERIKQFFEDLKNRNISENKVFKTSQIIAYILSKENKK